MLRWEVEQVKQLAREIAKEEIALALEELKSQIKPVPAPVEKTPKKFFSPKNDLTKEA